jgi:hypothetical protein
MFAYIIPIDASGHPSTGPVLPGRPTDPDYGHGGGGHPDNSLPWAPVRPGNKPPGRPILPPRPDNGLPPGGGTEPPHPWVPGHWEPVDPGYGMPPLWAFFPVDPGFGVGPPVHIGGGPAQPPVHVGGGPVLPPVINGGPIHLPGGIWIPTDPDWGVGGPVCPGGKPHPPLWGFIFNPPDFSKPSPVPEPKGGA